MILATVLLAFGGAIPNGAQSDSAAHEGVTVELPQRVDCVGVNLRMGDVAEVTGEDATLIKKVQDLNLGYIPSPGYSRLLYGNQLQATIKRVYPDLKVNFKGTSQVRVYPKTQLVTARQVEDVARKVVADKFAGLDVELVMRDRLNNLTVPSGRNSVELKARPASGPRGQGSQGVAVDILVDGELWRTQWTNWQVEAWENVPVLTTAVSRGQKLTPAMFKIERRKRNVSTRTTPLKAFQVREAQATRNLMAGSPVFSADVERTKVILKTHLVKVEVVSGRVTASSSGIAQEDGRIGDSIRVLLESSGRTVTGVVLGTNHVQVRIR